MLLPKRVNIVVNIVQNNWSFKGGNYVTFGEYGLQATTTSWITSRQIESARIAMTRYMKRGGKVGLKSSLIHRILKTFRSTYGCR